jgi:hypothetical protein
MHSENVADTNAIEQVFAVLTKGIGSIKSDLPLPIE